ncbi:MAG: pyridoxal phosphate-dependent aminotransferase [Planctomycetota bacterium]|nr:pyridoxal phosphate-dependent aminotransferase [Planctomycetota bacterium]
MRPENFTTPPYVEYFLTRFGKARYDLASSGRAERKWEEFAHLLKGAKLFDHAFRKSENRFSRVFLDRYGSSSGKELMCVPGTTGANFVAINALCPPRGTVAIERPVYDPLPTVAKSCGRKVRFFDRSPANGHLPDLEQLRNLLEDGAKLVVLTNPHNPTGVFFGTDLLDKLHEMLAEHDALCVVDEVYIEFHPDWHERTALKVGDRFLVTSSLTKVYGLSELTTGWLAGTAEVVKVCRRYFLLFTGHNSSPSMEIACALAPHLDALVAADRSLIEANLVLMRKFCATHNLELQYSDGSPVCLVSLGEGADDIAFAETAFEHELFVIPASFFGFKGKLRIGLFKDKAMFESALGILAKLL